MKNQTTLSEDQINFIKDAVFSGNPWDLYDSISDAGLETKQFWENSNDIEYMRAFAFCVLFNAVDSDGKCVI